jgi:hypothetical protein
MRNSLLHAGKTAIDANDLRKLEGITAKYVSLALFGDVNVFQMPKRATEVKRSSPGP